MAQPLMPKATAVWLIDNTTLTFEQIAQFCGLHALEIQGVADGEVAVGIRGMDPIIGGQISREEISRCENDPKARLEIIPPVSEVPKRSKSARYTPVSKRQERPNGIAWLIKNYPELSDAQIGKLLGTTKTTINSVRDRSHWNSQHISPQDPLLLGICSEQELVDAVNYARRRQERAEKRKAREEKRKNIANPETNIEKESIPNEIVSNISDLEDKNENVDTNISTETSEHSELNDSVSKENSDIKLDADMDHETLAEKVFGNSETDK